MKLKTKSKTEIILMVMHIVAWLAFIGFMIEAGALLVNYTVSLINPEATKNLYNKLNLVSLRQYSFSHYTMHMLLLMLVPILKAVVWYLAIKIAMKIKLANPFSMEVAIRVQNISYVLLGIWIVTVINMAQTSWLLKATGVQYGSEINSEYLFMAGLVFIISQVFKRGVEIQTENELTV
ncbi:MAG: DUF2975 domain-containing protein [Bacteroidia bacterium]